MSDNCAIVCSSVNNLICGCNSDGGKKCSGYCTCPSNRTNTKDTPTYSSYTAYCYKVNSYKKNNTKNNNDVRCS